MNHDSAEYADKSDWFSCNVTAGHSYEIQVDTKNEKDPYGTACIISSLNGGEQSCLAALDGNGLPCEWCVLASYEVCLTEDQADNFKVIGADCNKGPPTVATVGNVMGQLADPLDTTCPRATTQGDAVCRGTVDKAGQHCQWCNFGGGQAGACLNSEQAAIAEQTGAADCGNMKDFNEGDPFGTDCLVATLEGGEACKATKDTEGQSCEWCGIPGGQQNVCLNPDQASVAEQGGFQCESKIESINDPLDTACMIATLQGEGVCKATTDSDGKPCEWCTMQGGQANACMNEDQAAIAEQAGFDCDNGIEKKVDLSDPFDTSCLAASLQGDEATCQATVDQDGQACQWCALQGGQGNLCLNGEQAAIAEQIGVDCGDHSSHNTIEDPFDTSCLVASLQNDKATCESTVDQDGGKCKWCALSDEQGNLCLNEEQAEIAEQLGVDCDDNTIVAVRDPFDTTCLAATLQGDETTCKATSDEDGQPCEWCELSDGQTALCLNGEQASIAEQIGAECGDRSKAVDDEVKVRDPYDISCLPASLQGDASTCQATSDQDGHACEWCSFSDSLNLCLSSEQADIAAQVGADCTTVDVSNENEEGEPVEEQNSASDPYDIQCLNAATSNDENPEETCSNATDSTGQPCVWCDAAGVFGLCLSSEQASKAGQFLDCAEMAKNIVEISSSSTTVA